MLKEPLPEIKEIGRMLEQITFVVLVEGQKLAPLVGPPSHGQMLFPELLVSFIQRTDDTVKVVLHVSPKLSQPELVLDLRLHQPPGHLA